MGMIKDKLARAKSVISVKTYKRPQIYIILLMLFINLVILSIAALIAQAIDPSFNSFMDAFFNGSMTWMLTPNSLLEIDQPDTLALAVFVLITGLVLFSGLIIALTTNAIKDYIQKKQEGSGKIILDQHIVIINWNSKVPELVSDLLFVDGHEVTIMILADVDKTYAEKQITNAINKTKHRKDYMKLNVLVKQGDPLLMSDLEDISVSNAKTILIMNPDQHDKVAFDMSKSDLHVVKIILALGPIHFQYEPPIVVEIKQYETKEKIETLSRVVSLLSEHDIMPICFDKRLGQIIAQTLIVPKIEDVYLSLFSFQGSEVYQLKDVSVETCLKDYHHAIPLAQMDDHLFVLSENDQQKDKKHTYEKGYVHLTPKPYQQKDKVEVFIVGHNNKHQFILESFNAYESIYGSEFKARYFKDEEIETLVQEVNVIDHKVTILLLSDETQHGEGMDSNVIQHLIYLESRLTKQDVHIVVEILNPKNDVIVKGFSIENTIISNKIISLLLSKLALYKETAIFYENLLTIRPTKDPIDHQALSIVKASLIVSDTFPLHFDSAKSLMLSIYHVLNKEMMILGYFNGHALTILDGNLNEHKAILIEENTELILMTL